MQHDTIISNCVAGYLSADKAQWPAYLEQQRQLYGRFVQEMVSFLFCNAVGVYAYFNGAVTTLYRNCLQL